jgi:hypothetical protein
MVSVTAMSLPAGAIVPKVMGPLRSNKRTTNLTVPPAVVANALTVAESSVNGCVTLIPKPLEKFPPGAALYPVVAAAAANAAIGAPPVTADAVLSLLYN